MDKYHIYEEIGKGEFSQVFKGREKKKIEYVAIKRVDKSIMKLIVNEVQIMHKFDSPHVLRFHDWYETRNNLWLIVEYCTGGDLASLLKQDNHLPEESTRMFGLDLLSGLKYLHQLGIIHCDLQPRNILIDEYGILKVSDFKAAKKIPKQIETTTALPTEQSSPYVSPELLHSPHLYSYATDFWALGCILYQLRRGLLPFGGAATNRELSERIASTEPIHAPVLYELPEAERKVKLRDVPPFSAELADLLSWMLEKSPRSRVTWSDVCTHPFWGPASVDSPGDMPAQPVFEEYVRGLPEDAGDEEGLEQDDVAPKASTVQTAPPPVTPMLPPAREETRQEAPLPVHALEPSVDLLSILQHQSDVMIRPIVDNKAIESIEKVAVKTNSLPYHQGNSPVTTVEDIARMTQLQLETYLTQMYKYLLKTNVSSSSNLKAAAAPATSSQVADRCAMLAHLLSLSSSIEVANIVLNTHFLPLLLKFLRQSGSSIRSSTNAAVKTTSLSSAILARILGVTSLAIMLRYATFVQPPQSTPATQTGSVGNKSRSASASIKPGTRAMTPPTEDNENMLGTLVGIIKETATGKTSVHEVKLRRRAVAALGELMFYISSQEEGADGDSKWSLSSAAINVFVRCLFDENDEVTVHYVAKTIENIFAQGNLDVKRRFLISDVAIKLLELSQRNANPSFQATCAMALSHFFTVLMAMPTNETSPESPIQTPGAGAKLLVRVFEKCDGGLPSVLETLRDGDSRLQQAYLNLVNLVFASLAGRIGEQEVSAVDGIFRFMRKFFARPNHLLPLLMRIMEQGGSLVVRGKALICMQLLCRHSPSLLAIICERRFPQLLLRSLESTDGKDATYVQTASLSMLHFARDLALHCGTKVLRCMQAMIAADPRSPRKDIVTPSKYLNAQGDKLSTPESGLRQTPPSSLPSERPEQTDSDGVDVKALLTAIESLRAVASISSLPSLRRHTMGRDVSFLLVFADMLATLPSVVAALPTRNAAALEESTAALQAVEQVLLVIFETLSNLDLDALLVSPSSKTSTHSIEALLVRVVPAASMLLGYPKGDVRVVLTSSLRRLLPAICRVVDSLNNEALLLKRGACVKQIVRHVKELLRDFSPIPQYTLRMLMEVAGVSRAVEALLTTELVQSQGADVLVKLLSRQGARESSDSQLEDAVDPQISLLLHAMFKSSASVHVDSKVTTAASYLLGTGIAAGVGASLHSEVQSLQSSFEIDSVEGTGLAGSLHLLLDCLEAALASNDPDVRDHIASLESCHSTIYSLIALCIRKKQVRSKDINQLLCLCCVCLSVHLRLFIETGFRAFLNNHAQSPKRNAYTDSQPVTLLVTLLVDTEEGSDPVCGAVVSLLSHIVKLVANMNPSSKLRTTVAEIVSRQDLTDALRALSRRNEWKAATQAKKFLTEECKIFV